MGNAVSQIRKMAYGKQSVAPHGSGIGSKPKSTDLMVRRSRPRRLVTALRRGTGLG